MTIVPAHARAVALLLLASATQALGQAPASPASWEPRGPGGGGALFSPSLSPHAPQEMYVSCDMTELFHTSDYGLTWTQADFRDVGGNRSSLVSFTNDPNILYTIDNANRGGVDVMRPVKSTDRGSSWQPLPGDPTGGDSWAMLADPNDATRVFVASYGDLYASQDGGQNFRHVYADVTGGGGAYLAGIFTDGPLVLIGTNAGLLISNDGGQNFTLNTGLSGIDFSAAGEGMTGFAGAKEGGQTRLMCVTSSRGSVYLGMYGCEFGDYRGVYTMDWGTGTWTARAGALPAGVYPFYAGMARSDIDTMWVAGGSDAGSPVVMRSTNGGQNWADTFSSVNNQNIRTGWSGQGGDRGWGYGECAQGFGVSPVDPQRAVLTDYGFVHVTDDGGATWRQAYVAPGDEHPAAASTPRRQYYHSIGIENTTAWWLTWVDAQTIIGCYSDIQGTRSEDGGLTWGFDYTGHSENSMYHVVRHPQTGTLYAATGSVHDMYQSTRLADNILDAPGVTGHVLFSTDGGNAWQQAHDFRDVVVWLALDPGDPETLYASVVNHGAGTGGIWRTRNLSAGAGSTWTQLPAPPRTEGHAFNIHVLSDGALLATYSGRRNGGGAFTASSGVFLSTDRGASWLDRSDAGMHYWTKDVVIDPADATQSTWYVGVFSGWGGAPNGLGGLYRTRNRGQSWTRVNATDRVTSLAIDPGDFDHAYMTTEVEGLLETRNLTAAAPTFNAVAEYPFRQPERVFWNPFDASQIWVTSFGNGLKVGTVVASPAGTDLLRSTDITSLAPLTPRLDAVLPLDPGPMPAGDLYLADVVSPVVDPDGGSHPLVFYEITGLYELRVSLNPARLVQLTFTPS